MIALCTLVLLCLRRLIISFVSGCMRSTHYSSFVLYVLPSKKYKKDFHTAFQKIIRCSISRTSRQTLPPKISLINVGPLMEERKSMFYFAIKKALAFQQCTWTIGNCVLCLAKGCRKIILMK
jgi:hypothetical protein